MELRRMVLLLWACFLVRGLFYCISLPLWEGFDEHAHFAYVQRVAAGSWLVLPETRASREVERSVALVPMPWVLRTEAPPHETHDSYWRIPLEQRRSRERELAALPRSLSAQDAAGLMRFEWQQPPLSYWLMAPVCAALAGFPLSVRVLALRVLNLLLASVAVPAVWFAARRVFANRVAVATAALVVLMPEVMFDAARVANSGLTIALFSALAVLSLEVVDGRRGAALWMGAAFGLGLLAKGLFLCAVPAAAAVLAWAMWKGRLRLRSAVASLGLAVAISAWWYARSLRITGSLSGSPQDAALRHVPVFERLCRLTEVDWRTALDSTFLSHIWFGGWSFLQLRAWIYHFFAVLAVLAAVGLGVAWIRLAPARRHLFALASIYLFFCAGLAYHALTTYLANGMSSTAGWYLCAVVVPEAVLAAVGLRALAPARVQAYTVGVVACALALLDLYGMLFVALPYYTGLIGHKPNGSLEAFHFARLAETGLGEVLRRVATNKPAFIGPAAVGAAACAYIAATAAVAAIALVAEVWRPKADSRATPRPVV